MSWYIKTFEELSTYELYEILKSRAEIFVCEQDIKYVDPDDVDFDSIHIFHVKDVRVDAYLRAFRIDKDTIKIGRVLTLHHGEGLGTELMQLAIRELPKRTGCKRIHMDAQKGAVEFYKRLGFSVTSEEYLEAGIPHYDMDLHIK